MPDQSTRIVSVTPAIDIAGAYADGDCLHDTVLTISNVFRRMHSSGTLESVFVSDLTTQRSGLELILFNASPSSTTFSKNVALDVADGDLDKIIGRVLISTADYTALADNSIACLGDIGKTLQMASPGQDLYAAIIVRGTPTYTTVADIVLRLGIRPD